jgi:hypothetical protein
MVFSSYLFLYLLPLALLKYYAFSVRARNPVLTVFSYLFMAGQTRCFSSCCWEPRCRLHGGLLIAKSDGRWAASTPWIRIRRDRDARRSFSQCLHEPLAARVLRLTSTSVLKTTTG